ncbi:hypothetical protein GE061_006284 [Apolygus lucorum]|uniref:Peptidase S1 domain-containing protein n=1 Tax=Apolygus lucorum TaxID=248454 RepID=A0A8S9WW05_APOLU|nr:hypothetical protein GE061_006284 [Apolygus lucorum]
MNALWFASAWVLFCAAVYSLNRETVPRTKRVIAGTPVLLLNSEYASVRYVVWMSSGHNCERLSAADVKLLIELEGKNKPLKSPLPSCDPNPRNALCSGALLTPTIVQTACHCVVRFEGELKNGHWKAVTMKVWEDMYDIYPGGVPVNKMEGAKANHYIIHPKCTMHNLTGKTFHDFAVIVLRSPLAAKAIRLAPIYTIEGLADIWTRLMAKKSVCLNVGFGRYRLLANNKSDPIQSYDLLHGWVEAMDFIECYQNSNFEGNWFRYSDATWFCTKQLPSRKQHQSKGDSGGPVTCNNLYAGLVSFSFSFTRFNEYSYSASSSTAFTIFENSAEFRKSFIEAVQEREQYDSKSKVFNYRPTAPQIRQLYS